MSTLPILGFSPMTYAMGDNGTSCLHHRFSHVQLVLCESATHRISQLNNAVVKGPKALAFIA